MIKRKVSIILGLILLIGLAIAYLFLDGVNDYKVTNDGFYHVNGIEYDVFKGDRIEIIDDCNLIHNDLYIGEKTYSLPIYYRDEYKILLTTKMLYHQPNFNAKINKYKLKQLSEVSYNPSMLNVSFLRDGNNSNEQKGFLYDGNNTYIFLENMSITFNNKTIILPALSYAVVEHNAWIQAYDPNNNLYYFEDTKDTVYANCLDNSYKINLSNDIVEYQNNDIVLISSIDMFIDYFTGERE